MAPARRFSCRSMPSSRMREQSNRAGTRGSMEDLAFGFCFCCAWAEKPPRPISAKKTPVRTRNRPVKRRRLKKADCEADFFFISGYDLLLSVEVSDRPNRVRNWLIPRERSERQAFYVR